jgi:hypothetical protein
MALEKCFNNNLTLTGVSPPPLWLPDAINLGQALSPPSSYQHFTFHIIAKGIRAELNYYHFLRSLEYLKVKTEHNLLILLMKERLPGYSKPRAPSIS